MLSRRFRTALVFLASGCFVGSQIIDQPALSQTQTSDVAYITEPAIWTGHDGAIYPSGYSGCASFAGRGRFVKEVLNKVTFDP